MGVRQGRKRDSTGGNRSRRFFGIENCSLTSRRYFSRRVFPRPGPPPPTLSHEVSRLFSEKYGPTNNTSPRHAVTQYRIKRRVFIILWIIQKVISRLRLKNSYEFEYNIYIYIYERTVVIILYYTYFIVRFRCERDKIAILYFWLIALFWATRRNGISMHSSTRHTEFDDVITWETNVFDWRRT